MPEEAWYKGEIKGKLEKFEDGRERGDTRERGGGGIKRKKGILEKGRKGEIRKGGGYTRERGGGDIKGK